MTVKTEYKLTICKCVQSLQFHEGPFSNFLHEKHYQNRALEISH